MTFHNLHADTPCNCITEDAFEDSTTIFARKINKPQLRVVDFDSGWEKAEVKPVGECGEICGHKGVSVSKVSREEDRTAIIDSCLKLFPIAPKYKPHLCFFTAKEKMGVFMDTPNDKLAFHHDFFKSDAFTVDGIVVNSIIALADYV